MSMDLRGDTWRFRIKYKGKLYTDNFKGDEKTAKKAHELFKATIITGQVNQSSKMKMYKLIEIVMKEYVLIKCRVNTQRIYRDAYNKYIMPEFGMMELRDIKPIHIQKFANKLGETLKPNTVSNILARLSKTLTLAEKWEIIDKSTYRNIDVERERKNNQAELLPMEEIEKLLMYYSNQESNLLHKAAFF